MSEIYPGTVAAVRMIADSLSTDELFSIYIAAAQGGDPRGTQGYEKGRGLFTQEAGTKMHADTLEALDVIVQERLDGDK